jgi:1-acyl-sn-glycerol-3-phosphate acyltransferase
MSPQQQVVPDVPAISGMALRLFRHIVRRYFQRHFRAVLAQHAERLRGLDGPLIVYTNHASWWDPMVAVLLAELLLPERKHYGPMDAVPLARYGILRRMGVFPVALDSVRGAAQFLRVSEAILRSGGVLWMTPQGRFADVRERPLSLKSGLATLALRVPQARLVPVAIEYTFWDERLPETLLRVGMPVRIDAALKKDAASELLAQALEHEMCELQDAALTRDPLRFQALIEGARGTGGMYALGKRLRAVLRGRSFSEGESARDRRAGGVKR